MRPDEPEEPLTALDDAAEAAVPGANGEEEERAAADCTVPAIKINEKKSAEKA